MTNRYKSKLKQLLGIDKKKSGAVKEEQVGGIPSVRGIGSKTGSGVAYGGLINGSNRTTDKKGNQTSSSGGSGSSDGSGIAGSGITDKQNLGQLGQSTGPDPGDLSSHVSSYSSTPDDEKTREQRLDEGTIEAADLLDPDSENALDLGLPIMDTNRLSDHQLPSSQKRKRALNEILAVDCSTGEKYSIFLNNRGKPKPATTLDDGTEITAEWLDVHTPPEISGWTSGTLYGVSHLLPEYHAPTLGKAGESALQYINDNFDPPGDFVLTGEVLPNGANRWSVGVASPSDPLHPVQYVAVLSYSCTPGSSDACPIEAPTESSWPEDVEDRASLLFDNGGWEMSPYDPKAADIPEKSGQKQSRVNFCFQNAAAETKNGSIEAGKNGGFLLYETQSNNGDLVTDGRVMYFDSNGVWRETGVGQSYLNMMRPQSNVSNPLRSQYPGLNE